MGNRSLVVSFMASFVLSFFPLDVLGGIWDLIESVSEGFLIYSLTVTCWIKSNCHFRVSGLFCHFYSIFDGNISKQYRP